MAFWKKPFSFVWSGLIWLWNHKRISGALLIIGIAALIFWPRPKPSILTQTLSKKQFIQSISVSGSVVAKKTVNLTFPISGRLAYVGVKKGDIVTAGQVLASIDQQTAQKNLQATLIAYSLQRNTFDQKQSDNQNRTPQEALNDDMKRILQNNQYNLDQAVNSVELQDLAKKQAVLWTPISGIVTRADTELAGPDAVAGSTTFTVTDPSSLAFDADVDQSDIGKVSQDLPVHIVFDAYTDATLSEQVSRIDFISHTTTNGGNAFTVETPLPTNTDNKYRVGMNANADIILSQKENVLSIPLSSVVNDHFVYVKADKGFKKTNIKLGMQNDTDAEVLSGLSEGDVIALDPQLASTQAVK